MSAQKNYKLTANELKKYKGNENIGDDEALQLAEELKDLSHLLYNAFMSQKKKQATISKLKSARYED